ncbi:MAG: hypothetical protein AB9883_10535 [Acidaminococcaceae bacterium]
MQWQSFIMDQRKGMVSLSVLLLATVLLTILQGFFLLVNRESEAQTDNIRQEQILNLGESLIKLAVRNEDKGNLSGDIQLQKVTLYPGNEEFMVKIAKENDISLGVRQIKISLESSSKKWNIYEDKLSPPGGADNPVYQNAVYAQNGIAGNKPAGVIVQEGNCVIKMPYFDASGYKKYGKMVLPTADDLRDYGLKKRLYVNTAAGNAAYSVAEDTVIKGDGVFVDEAGITINERCTAAGKLWLISGSGIIIGDNVKLDKALLIAKKNISIGNNVSINGIIISGGKVTIGNGLTMTREKMVLEPFSTAYYFL